MKVSIIIERLFIGPTGGKEVFASWLDTYVCAFEWKYFFVY